MLITIIRTVILYITVVMVMRLMGKRQIGQLQPFEFVVTIMIAELASIPMEETGIPLIRGLTPIIILFILHVTISLLSLKSQSFRRIICGTPSVLIEKGKIKEKELRKLRYSISDLLEQLRVKNYSNINDVEFAVLETNGQLSVIPKAEKQPVVAEDINIINPPTQLPLTLVLDGVMQQKNLDKLNLDKQWLLTQLKAFGIAGPEDALIAIVDTGGQFYAQPKAAKQKGLKKNA